MEWMLWSHPHAPFKIKAAIISSVMGEFLLTALSFISRNRPQLKRVSSLMGKPLGRNGN